MNQLTVITDMPEWVLRLADNILVALATVFGYSVSLSSVKITGADND